jgi:predicted ester cyclase
MPEDMKTKSIRIWEAVWNEGKVDLLDEIVAPHCVRHRPPFPDFADLAAFKKHVLTTRASYPDAHLSFDQMICQGDWWASLWTWSGTQTGVSPTTGAPPTNKHVTMKGCTMTRKEGDKIVEEWELDDHLGLFQQLGIIPKLG